jgi:hypothetical protein
MRWGLSKGIEKDVLAPLSEKVPMCMVQAAYSIPSGPVGCCSKPV